MAVIPQATIESQQSRAMRGGVDVLITGPVESYHENQTLGNRFSASFSKIKD